MSVAGCGDDPATGGNAVDISDADRATYDLVVEAHDIKFDKDAYEATSGDMSIAYIEEGNLLHNLVIEGSDELAIPIAGGDRDGKLIVTIKSDATGTVTLAPGSYTLICKVQGHAAAGMEATLTVS